MLKAFCAAAMCFGSVVASGQQVAVTFDDLPSHGALPAGVTRMDVARQILAVIKKEKLAPVTGMVNGVRVKSDPEALKVLLEWRNAGQPLASHTYTHMNLNQHTVEEWEKDVLDNEPLLESLMKGEDWKWLRYPNLAEGDTQEKRLAARKWLGEHGYKVAEVTLEFNDYNWNPPYARCMAKRDEASIQRLHDLYLGTARQHFGAYREAAKQLFGHEISYVLLLHIGAFDARMFPELIAQMKKDGFTFVSLADAEKDPAYAADPATMSGGGPFQDQLERGRGMKGPLRNDPSKELDTMCR